MKTVLVTGAAGFIGRALMRSLADSGWNVRGLDLRADTARSIYAADLLDSVQVKKEVCSCGTLNAVIHLAAIAHGQNPPAGHTCYSFNLETTRNLLDAVEKDNPAFVLASSVAVYGEAGRGTVVTPADEPQPATEYGRSKLACEQLAARSSLSRMAILRFAPVFDESHMRDVSKRVFLPGIGRVRMCLVPEPKYSLCHIRHVVTTIVELLNSGITGRWVDNVSEPRDYGQHELVEWFSGPRIALPRQLFFPLSIMSRCVPGRHGYAIQCMLAKLLETHSFQSKPTDLKFTDESNAAAYYT